MADDVKIRDEALRLHEQLQHVGFNEGYCEILAPLTLEINKLKKERGAVILAHSYQTPDIIYGVADFKGDSYGLSKEAKETDAEVIVFAGVRFMAETAKILNPGKKVLLPAPDADCSLADSITGEDVRAIKAKHPGVPVVVYVNTSAEVKAESDACCTSANAEKVLNGLDTDEIIFLPDELMAANLQKITGKKLITWHGRCIVHEDFRPEKVEFFKKKHPGLKVLSHSECAPSVVEVSDLVGGTSDMIRYVKDVEADSYMLITECGLSDRMRVEFPEKEFIGMCSLCPYMKKTTLQNILGVLKEAREEQIVEIPEDVRIGAERALNKMFELSAP